MSGTFTLDLRRSPRLDRPAMYRNLRLLEAADEQSPQAVRAAEKLVIASRENVRFLTRHLKPYQDWLDLPALVDNALYLAFTVTVRKTAPFGARALRRELRIAGIETSENFRFGKAAVDDDGDCRTFCLPCHQYLTIRDLEYIIDTFETFFAQVRHSQTRAQNAGRRGTH